MNIYRLSLLAVADLPPSAIVDAVVVAQNASIARGLIVIEETNRDQARAWLRTDSGVSVIEVGQASQDYLDDLIGGDTEPHVLTIERRG